VTAMKPGDKIKVYYDPRNPRDISTLALLGTRVAIVIFAVAFAFLAFYVWFFWLRRFLRRSDPDDFDGDKTGSFAASVRPAAIDNRSTGTSFDTGRGATFGRR